MRETVSLGAERLLLARNQARAGELARLEAQELDALGRRPLRRAPLGECLRGRLDAGVAASHLLHGGHEPTDRVE